MRKYFKRNDDFTEEMGERMTADSSGEKRNKKRALPGFLKSKKFFFLLGLIVLSSGAFILIRSSSSSNAEEADKVIREAEAKVGNLTTTISSSGTLQSDDSESIDIPEGIEVEELLVSEGDSVEKGQKLAKAKPASVAKLLLSIRDEIDSLEDEIDDLDDIDDTTSDDYLNYIVYKDELEDYEEAEAQLEAILETGYVTADQAGTIGAINISTSSDSSTESSETSTQTSNQTSTTGNDTSSSSATTASATSLTASSMAVKSSGGTSSASGLIHASRLSAGADDSQQLQATEATVATTETTETATETTEAATESTEAATEATTEATVATTETTEAATEATTETTETTTETTETTTTEESTEEKYTTLTAISSGAVEEVSLIYPSAGSSPQTEIDETDFYKGKILWDPEENFQAGKTYTATLILTAKEGYAFSTASDYAGISMGDFAVQTVSVKDADNTEANKLILVLTASVAADTATDKNSDSTSGENTSSGNTSSDNTGSSAAATASTSNKTSTASTQNKTSTAASKSGGSTAGGTSSGSSSSSSSTSSSSSSSSAVDMTEAFTMISEKTMVVSVTVDEADINSVSVGQTADVSLEALDGSQISGQITDVGRTASSSDSGSSKYTVEITVDKTEGMLEGMSATAVINIEEAENAIQIPSAAIHEKAGKTYVYTKKEDDGTLSGEVEVSTGLSDGGMVQITSGLSEGDKVYYEISGSSDQSDGEGNREFDGQGGPGGQGGPPSGGGQGGGHGGM